MTVFGLPALRTLLGQQTDADIRRSACLPVPENDRRRIICEVFLKARAMRERYALSVVKIHPC